MLRVYPLPPCLPTNSLGCEAHPCDKRGRSPSAVANQRASPSRPTADIPENVAVGPPPPIQRFICSTTGSIRSKLGYASVCANLSRLWLRASPMRPLRRQRKANLAATNAWRYRPPAGIVQCQVPPWTTPSCCLPSWRPSSSACGCCGGPSMAMRREVATALLRRATRTPPPSLN
jgi:hypothetical protein